MAFQCLTLGDSLYQNGLGELEVQLATDSGLEILASGLNIIDEQRAPTVQSYTPTFRIGGTTSANDMSNFGASVYQGWYQQTGEMIDFNIYFSLGAGCTFGHTGVFYFGTPTTPYIDSFSIGTAYLYDASVAITNMTFVTFADASGTPHVVMVTEAGVPKGTATAVPTLGGVGDKFYLSGRYRTA